MPLSAHEFERRLIFYASPTLTKLKVACMYNLNDLDDLEECIDYYNEILNKKDIYLKDSLLQYPITFFCIHGNHEERPENITSYKTKIFHGLVNIPL